MDDIADIWEERFKLCLYTRMYPDNLSLNTSNDLRSFVTFIHDIVCFKNTSLATMVYNSYNYNTYFGNFAHGICYKIVDLISDHEAERELFPYINCLFGVTNCHYINLRHLDYYGNTPLEIVKAFEDYCYQKDNITYTQRIALNVLVKIVDPDYCIVTKCQSYIRRWIARRQARRMQLKRVLDELLYAPFGQVELNSFPSFPGGTKFHQCIQHLEDTSLDVHVRYNLLNSVY